MSSKTSPVGARFVFFLLVISLLAIGIGTRAFFKSAHATTTAAFTPGNIVVYRVGDGSGALGTGAAPVFLDEFTPAGVPVQTIPMPTAVSGANKRLTAAGNSTSEGFLTRSVDGNYLILAGYDAAVATAAVAGTTSAATNRVIGRVDVAGNVDTSTALTDAISAGNPRGATSTNGTDLWISGTSAGGGIRYATIGATTSTSLNTVSPVTNLRATNIFGGQLYVSSASGTTRLVAVGTGTPTTAGQTLNSIPGLDNTTLTGPYAFFFADLNAGVAGNDTLYVADEGANLIKKFSLVSGTWTANGSMASTLVRGITGTVSGSNVTLAVQNNGATLSTLTDTSGYNATITGTLTPIATAAANTAFRGVVFAPAAATPTLNVGDVTQIETDAGTTTFTFNVSLTSPAPAGGVTFDVATADGTAQDGVPGGEDNDYVAKSETGRTITAGNSSTTFTVTVNGDTTPESNETFFVNVTNVTGATPGDLQGQGTITNDDNVTPTLNIDDVTQAETNAGTTTFTFNVSLTSPALAGGVTFDIATADGTAQDGVPGGEDNDYVAKSETGRTITAGNSSTTFTVTINGDATTEPNETFFVNVTNITGATAGDVQGLGTITNDDINATPIHSIQGSGSTSPFATQSVTTTGIVTGLKTNGFFLQTPDNQADANSETSEGIFVFTSSAPPAAAAIGNLVSVTATVQEFIPTQDLNSPPVTELITPTVNVISTGNGLPAAITITAAETTQPSETTNPMDSLEEYEGMRVTVPSLTVTGATQGTINEPNATVTSTGIFLGVVTGVARPFREPGIPLVDPVPAPNPPNVPRFDENPERIRVDSDAQPGTTALDVTAGTVLTNITGPLDYAFRCYTIDPDAGAVIGVGAQPGSTAVPTPAADEFTVASFNMERFFDTTDDPGVSDVALTAVAFNRRVAKASLIIRTMQRLPDVIGVEEMENLSTLQTVATQVNNDVVGGGGSNPNYQAYLVEGNDVGGIDVGFLVKASRFTVVEVTQFGKATTYINPNNNQPELLNDRPPLLLRGYIERTPPGTFTSFTVIVNHLRSLGSIDDPADGNRVRTKRNEQAKFLANLIQTRQAADPNEKIITVGDMNAFRVNDGYVDVIGTLLGTPAPADQVVLSAPDLVNPDQTDLVDTLSAAQQYSYNFDGNAQTLDHIIVNPPALAVKTRFAYARNDSDFAVKNYESTNELRISDHDQPVAYFSLSGPTAANGSITGRITGTDGGPVSGAVVQMSGGQNRKTITDANGNYHFGNVQAGGFYTVTPSRANYTFSPATRAFSLVGGQTEAAFTGVSIGDSANPLDTAEFFVRQQYRDLLGREPDEGGFNYWSDQINQCGNDTNCVSGRRRDVAAAFFIEQEAQVTSSYIYGLYKGALGRRPVFQEYVSDRQQVVGGADLESRKQAFAESFVRRADFVQKYQQNLSAESFVDAMVQNLPESSGVDLGSQRNNLIGRYNSGANLDQSRSFVVRDLTESSSFKQSEYNAAFVLSEYFGYLQRGPDAAGYAFWLSVLNNGEGNYRGMVCAFINSAEYQLRFSSVVSRGDGECAH